MRCVITGLRTDRSVFEADGSPQDVIVFPSTPGMEVVKISATGSQPTIGTGRRETSFTNATFLPAVGETRFYILSFPPDSMMTDASFDLAAAGKEFAELLPEMAATREAEDPAMHRTDTIDHIVVLEGEVWLELDDQKEVLLRQHDVVVQNGTRHAWRNKSDRPVVMAIVMVGASRAD